MSSKAIVWIREDFRINLNPALSHACQNHNEVVALYIFNPKNFINKREAQLWWISKSLESYSKELSNFNINLEIQKGDEIEFKTKRYGFYRKSFLQKVLGKHENRVDHVF